MDRLTERAKRDFVWVDRLAWLLDERFRLGNTRFRFGLDPLINFIPFLGDLIGFAMSTLLVVVIWRNGASRKVIMLMLINVLVDTTIGSIPIIGNVFDFFFKANSKNVVLLREHYYQGKHQGRGADVLAVLFGVILLLTMGFIYLLWKGLTWLVGLF